MVGGCFDKGTYTFGETIRFNVPSEIEAFINKPVPNPDAKLSISWYRKPVSGSSVHLNNDGKTSYTVTAADINCSIYAVFSYDTHISSLETERVSVQKKICNDLPVTPALAFRQNYVWVTNNKPAQEYLLLSTYKSPESLTEADWAKSESSTASSFRLSGAPGQVNYVYTRYMETATQLPGSVVRYDAIYSGTTTEVQDVQFEITDITTNTPVEIGKGGFTQVLYNHVIKIDLVPVPENVTNFYGLLGAEWFITSRDVTYYSDAACTKVINDGEWGKILKDDAFYKTLYAKFQDPTEYFTGSGANHMHLVSFRYKNVDKIVEFVVSKPDGTYNLLNLRAANGHTPNGADYEALYVPAGTIFDIPMDHTPVDAPTDGITFSVTWYSQNGVENTGNPPTLSYYKDSDGQLILRVNTTNTEDGFYGTYGAKQNGRNINLQGLNIIYVTAPEPTGLAINPGEITLEPLFGEAQLEAIFTPANAKPMPITWSSSNQDVVTVDQNGKVTVAEDAIGDEATITATAGSFTATCKVIVSGQKYPIWVKGTQINSLIQDDVFMDGTVSYEGGTLTLNGATISGGAKEALRSEVPNLTINVEGTNSLTTTSGEAVALVKSAYITGDGELTVTTKAGSNLSIALAGYEDLTIDGSVKVSASNNSSAGIGVVARRLSVNSPEAQLKGNGKFASVGYFEELVGTVIDPQGCKPVYYEGLNSYFIGDASGNIVRNAWVTIDGGFQVVESFNGKLWQEVASNGSTNSSSETNKTVELTYSIENPEQVKIAFPAFSRADTEVSVSGFSIKDVNAFDYENGSTLYTLPEEIAMTLQSGTGVPGGAGRMPVRNMMVNGAKSESGQFVMKLTMRAMANMADFTLWFGPDNLTLQQLKAILNETEDIITGVDDVEIERTTPSMTSMVARWSR